MKDFTIKLKHELNCELPIMYYFLEESESPYHRIKETSVKSDIYQTKIKVQKYMYKPIINLSLKDKND